MLTIYCSCYIIINQIFVNIGYGAIASVLVSLIIDIGNTKIQRKKEKSIFDRLNSNLKSHCDNLQSEIYISVYECFEIKQGTKYTFEEWVNLLFDSNCENKEKQNSEISYIIQHIMLIKEIVLNLKANAIFFYDNKYCNEEYEKKLDQIIAFCNRIENNYKRNQNDACKRDITNDACKRDITNDFKNAVISLFPELKEGYTKKYNEDDHDS